MRLRTRLFLVSATTALFAVAATALLIYITSTPASVVSPEPSLDDAYYSVEFHFIPLAIALIVALAGAAILSWLASRTVGARIGEIVGMANRLSSGDLGSRVRDVRQDEFGELGRALDDAVQSLGQKVGELARDRARMEAILGGMVEGVLVVN